MNIDLNINISIYIDINNDITGIMLSNKDFIVIRKMNDDKYMISYYSIKKEKYMTTKEMHSIITNKSSVKSNVENRLKFYNTCNKNIYPIGIMDNESLMKYNIV